MGFTAACIDAGLRAACPIEKRAGEHFDLSNPAIIAEIIGWMRDGLVWLLFLAPPCSSWSTAARGQSGHTGSLDITLRLLRAARKFGVEVVVENPHSSRLWSEPRLSAELAKRRPYTHLVHHCAYEAAWKKATRFVSTLEDTIGFARQCPGHPRHVVLQGIVYPRGRACWRTSFAAAYPPRLCHALASWVSSHARQAYRRRPQEGLLGPSWERRLAIAAGTDPNLRCVAAPASRPRQELGWESSVKQWGGRPPEEELRIMWTVRRSNRASEEAQRKAPTGVG